MALKQLYRFSNRHLTHLAWRAMQATHHVNTKLWASPHRHNHYQVLRVDPHQITHLAANRLPQELGGTLLDGDWDADVVPLSATTLHRGLAERFIEGRDWLDTVLHPARYTRRWDNEPSKYTQQDEVAFLRRAQELDRLYERLAEKGYLSHKERGEPAITEMSVNITRDGYVARHTGGMHRLLIAQLLGLPQVPVRVFAVHAECLGTAHDPFRDQRPATSDPVTCRRYP